MAAAVVPEGPAEPPPRLPLGLVTPVVSLNPAAHNAWEREATVDDLVRIAVAADRLGLHHLTASHHVAIPRHVAERRGGRYYDPLATLTFLAAHTVSIGLATHVLVLGYQHPLTVAKQYGTLDRLSGGRVILGVGVGSLQEEFELLDAAYSGRGRVADDRLRTLRSAWASRDASRHRSDVDFEGFVVDPSPVQAHVPIWVGGRSHRSLRRALELGDGWVPFGLSHDELGEALAEARDGDLWERRRRDGFQVVLHPRQLLDPQAEPGHVTEVIGALRRDLEADLVNVRLRHEGPTHAVEQLEALASLPC